MMIKQRKQEKGAIIIEIIAVVALLGVMGPMIFKQISDRNDEVENINIATEIRMVKEAFSSYIISNRSNILNACAGQTRCAISNDNIKPFLPVGFEDTADFYTLYLYRRTTDAVGANPQTDRLYGYVVPDLGNLGLDALSLKRVARIAALTGADGGIKRKNSNEINGTGGAWTLTNDEITAIFGNAAFDANQNYFVASTGLDTFVPTITYEEFDPSNVLLPNNIAFGRLHAWNFFSVGSADEAADTTCFKKENGTADTGDTVKAIDDTIYDAGATNHKNVKCDPLFWVTTSSETGTGDVFIKNTLHFRNNSISGIKIVSGASSNDTNDNTKIEIFDSEGKNRITINAKGEIIAVGHEKLSTSESVNGTSENETLTIKNGRIESNRKAPNASDSTLKTEAFRLDPSYTSVMNEIRLESMGGARLSELLPKYLLKDISTIISTYEGSTAKAQLITMPSCPNNYVPGIVITPIQWHQTTQTEILDTVVNNLQVNLSTLPASIVTKDDPSVVVNEKPIVPRVSISYGGSNTGYINTLDSKPAGENPSWSVTLDYENLPATVSGSTLNPIQAMVHTYCIFNSSISGEDIRNTSGENGSLQN